jgi:hypothetical protein
MTDSQAGEQFAVETLRPQGARMAYPLIALAEPRITLRAWLQFSARLPKGPRARRGVLVARRPGKMPCGAVCYRAEKPVANGPTLVAEHFVAVDLLYPEHVAAALLRGLECVALRLRCQAIRAVLPARSAPLAAVLGRSGEVRQAISVTVRLPLEQLDEPGPGMEMEPAEGWQAVTG